MKKHADKPRENKRTPVAYSLPKQNSSGATAFQFADTRPEAVAGRVLQEQANDSPGVKQLKDLQEIADNSRQVKQLKGMQAMANSSPAPSAHAADALNGKAITANVAPIQKKENKTGLPGKLKSGAEQLSGYALDDVKVHYNSGKPAQMRAHAYAQGTEIHLAPGQEKHLPHEAWHVVQQKQGRVKPTLQLKEKININDDKGLETEADTMGTKAMQYVDQPVAGIQAGNTKKGKSAAQLKSSGYNRQTSGMPVQRLIVPGKFNLVGERHDVSGAKVQMTKEEKYAKKIVGGGFWKENHFRVELPNEGFLAKGAKFMNEVERGQAADPFVLRVLHGMLFLRTEAHTPGSTYRTTAGWLEEMNINIGNLKNKLDGDDMSAPAQETLKKMGNFFGKVSQEQAQQKVVEVKKHIDPIISKWKDIAAGEQIARNKTPIAEHSQLKVVKSDDFASMKAIVSNARSVAMHLSAIEACKKGVVGVWKIGQQHLEDILKLHKNEYPITGDQEFVTDVNIFHDAVKRHDKNPAGVVDAERKKRITVKENYERAEKQRQDDWQAYLKTPECRELNAELIKQGNADIGREVGKAFNLWRLQLAQPVAAQAAPAAMAGQAAPAVVNQQNQISAAAYIQRAQAEYDGYYTALDTLKKELPVGTGGAVFMMAEYMEIGKKRETAALGKAAGGNALLALAPVLQAARVQQITEDLERLRKDLCFKLMMKSSNNILDQVMVHGHAIQKEFKPFVDRVDAIFTALRSGSPWLTELAARNPE